MPTPDDSLIWHVRHFIYRQLAQTGRAPQPALAAQALGTTLAETEAAYQQLHQRHAILLQPGTTTVRMANPFSAVPTDFKVRVGPIQSYANCAWDALGIPAALHANGQVTAHCAQTGELIKLTIQNGNVLGDENIVAHFAVPFAHWYDNLIHT